MHIPFIEALHHCIAISYKLDRVFIKFNILKQTKNPWQVKPIANEQERPIFTVIKVT